MASPSSPRSDPGDRRPDRGDRATVATHFARPLARALRSLGTDPGPVLGALAGPDAPARIPSGAAAQAWDRAVEATGEPALGPIAAGYLVAGDYGLMEYLARSSASLAVAAERLGRFHRLMNDGAGAVLTGGPVGPALRYLPPSSPPMPRACVEFVLATWARIAREASGEAGIVTAVRLPYPAPRDLAPYREAFGPVVESGALHAELAIDPVLLARPLPTADTGLHATLEQHAESVLASRADGPGTWAHRVEEALRPCLADGPPRLADAARALGLGERALRRRLEDEGTTFAAVVAGLRQRLALAMVEDASLSLGEIAFLLGFSEPSAFHRAFRRWTGRTPRPRGGRGGR